jgi:MFS family permease
MVALGVVAFENGGPAAVGIVAALRMLPGALLAPFAATVADAVRRERVLVGVGLVRAGTLAAAAGVLAIDGPLVAVGALVALATVAQTLYRPAHSALLPALCAGPEELTSANVVRGLLDSLATLVGPLAAAVGLSAAGPAVVFAACAGCSLGAGALVVGLAYEAPFRSASVKIKGRAALDGLKAIMADRDLLLITGLTTAQTFTRGALSVMSVIVAVSLLDTGAPGVGILNGAVGAGAVVGSFLALLLVRPGRLARWLGIGVMLWGLPLAGVGALPHEAAAIALLAIVGIGNALVDVGAFTLPARLADETVMARVFAAFEGILTLGVVAGAAVAPVVIELLGIRGALVTLGFVGPVAAAAAWPALRRLDLRMLGRDADIRLLRLVPLFEPLPQATMQQLSATLERETVTAGASVFEQGAIGARVYVVEFGSAEVVRNGLVVATLERGDCFGEIALLRNCARTATVRAAAAAPLGVASLSGAVTVGVVTACSASAAAGAKAVTSRLRMLTGPVSLSP